MADLVTHVCSALLPGAVIGGRWLPLVAIGAAAPDMASRAPGITLRMLYDAGVSVPDPLFDATAVMHMPVGMLLGSALASYVFREAERASAFLALFGGCLLHIGVDVLQNHHGSGYQLLFPFTVWSWELGLVGSEQTVDWAPWIAGATVMAWGIRLAIQSARGRR